MTLTASVRAACDAVIPGAEPPCYWPQCNCRAASQAFQGTLALLLTTARAVAAEAERKRCARVVGDVMSNFLARATDAESDAVAGQYAARAVGAQAVWEALRAAPAAPSKDTAP